MINHVPGICSFIICVTCAVISSENITAIGNAIGEMEIVSQIRQTNGYGNMSLVGV